MNDIDLLDFMVRQYQTQAKLSEALNLTDGAISKWRSRGELPNAWRMYFQAQFDKANQLLPIKDPDRAWEFPELSFKNYERKKYTPDMETKAMRALLNKGVTK